MVCVCARVALRSGDDAMMLQDLGVMITNGSHTSYICVRSGDDATMLYYLEVMITNGSRASHLCVR